MLENRETENEKMMVCDKCGKSPAGTLNGHFTIRFPDLSTRSGTVQNFKETEADRIDLCVDCLKSLASEARHLLEDYRHVSKKKLLPDNEK